MRKQPARKRRKPRTLGRVFVLDVDRMTGAAPVPKAPKTAEARVLAALLPTLTRNRDVGPQAQRAERILADYSELATDTTPEGRQRARDYLKERIPTIARG